MNERFKSILRESQVNLHAQMVKHFYTRTITHIDRVKGNAARLAIALPKAGYPEISDDLMKQVSTHDDSKWVEPEFTPYLHVSWKYKMLDDGETYEPPQEILDAMHNATLHHVRNNKHHPEYHDPDFTEDSLSKGDRDSVPEIPVQAHAMDQISIAEMICDFVAMSQEKSGNNDASDWIKQNVGKRWIFDDTQVKWIWDFHEALQ